MKIYLMSLRLFILIIAVFSLTSCAKKTYSHKYKNSASNNQTRVSPVSRKATPISKNYVIKNKNKTILGQSGRFKKHKKPLLY
jgi:uncharacterized lipoprotein YehR (DUF1307 family)